LAAIASAACVLGAAPAAVADFPTGEQIVERVKNANAGAPNLAAADAQFKFRLDRAVTAPPDCEFAGTFRFEGGRQFVNIGQQTAGLECWALNKLLIGRLFQGSEPVQRFLARFQFEVLGWKLVDGRPFYLVKGWARDPSNNPRSLIGWIDYERGLVTDGTVEYGWGSIDTVQRYAVVSGAWVLVHQYLVTPRFGASMEVEYSNFRFSPR
jgi:hypothetical protein